MRESQAPSPKWEEEVDRGERFSFGENWAAYLGHIDEDRIRRAEASLKSYHGVESFEGQRFLDIGSGSGLFSLAARRLGADVTSFDYDPQSVGCTAELRRRYFSEGEQWEVLRGSVLDKHFLGGLGTFDIVYSWGVLHHTGAMWEALENACSLVAPGGRLHIALYNDQGRASRRWRTVKKTYLRAPGILKWAVVAVACARLWTPTIVRETLRGRPLNARKVIGAAGRVRGMHPWRDVVDWVGGYPFEVSRPEEVFDFCSSRGFGLSKLRTCAGGLGCNEFVFVRR
jgi:2-polyprenyl-6-hydroxyphenyl methylase/3-demethylubiquinone-9 3-methyltransferase